jgi:hypothetical protein
MVNANVDRQPRLARRYFDRLEPVHAVTYFAPEARAALDGLGFHGFWMGYFAARSAPFGVVPTEVVTAAFYSFAPHRVAKALTAAWDIASPTGRSPVVRRQPRAGLARGTGGSDYDDDQWSHHREGLIRRGVLDERDELTAAGHELKQRIEDPTDELALRALDALDDDEVDELFRSLTPITRKVASAGDVPAATPMGLGRDDLDDDSARLTD